MRDKLTSFVLLNPNPPKAFGRQIESQDLRDKFRVLLREKPHQKFLNISSSLLEKLAGRRKEHMA
jgi:hypothetical protein